MAKTQIVSWSEIAAFRDCPHKHDLGYVQRWEAPEPSIALSRGIEWHRVMELHYGALKIAQEVGWAEAKPLVEPLAQRIDAILGRRDPRQTEIQSIVEWMYDGYCARWPLTHELSDWKVLAVEHPAEIWLPTPRGGRSRFRLKMKIDLIVRIGGRIWIVDHKSGRDLPKHKELDLDDQFGLYCWGLRRLGHSVHGAIYNSARTLRYKDPDKPQPLDERFDRYLLHRTDHELDVIAAEAYATCAKAWSVTATRERTPDTDQCGWKCDFEAACIHGRKGYDERGMLIAKGFRQIKERH